MVGISCNKRDVADATHICQTEAMKGREKPEMKKTTIPVPTAALLAYEKGMF